MQLIKIVNELKPDFVFLGSFGRKTVTDDMTRIGSTLLATVTSMRCPVLAIKHLSKRSSNPSKGFAFLICWDGKVSSVLNATKKLASNENDSVTGVSVCLSKEEKDKAVESWNAECARIGMKYPLNTVEDGKEGKETILLEYINNHKDLVFDFTVFGVRNVHTKQHTISEKTLFRLMNKALTNLVFVPEKD